MSPPVSAMITSATAVEIPGDGDDEVPGGTKGFHHHLDPRGQLLDRTSVVVDEVEVQPGEEAVVLVETAGESLG